MQAGTLLAESQLVSLATSGSRCRVDGLLGVGGQGEVYSVHLEAGSQPGTRYAFKAYHPASATKDQWTALHVLVDLGSPSARFLWPLDLAEIPDRKTFGYLMAVRDPRFSGMVDLVRRSVSTTFTSLVVAGFQLADSFLQLHSRGLCYRDISLGNVFFDPQMGSVLICDNDNVAVDGQGHQSVLGTTGFMAPEIERLEAYPSTRTDLHSLAVLLFLIFINHHPLIGKRELAFASLDQDAFRSLYGTDPVFVFDPNDESNRPVLGVHDNAIVLWPLYPRFFRDLFTRAFTDGLRDPVDGRIRESQWKSATARLRDSIIRCGCGAELFYDDDLGTIAGETPGTCWACKGHPSIPPRLHLGRQLVMLNPDTVLFPHHLGGDLYDYSTHLGRVTEHPLDPRVRGLQNLTDDVWVATDPDGMEHRIGRERSVRLIDGMTISFPRLEGRIAF
jgi:eukaryotic-like serine/threonine-protein kinase